MKRLVLLALSTACLSAHAASPDFSGTYECKGMDAKEGKWRFVKFYYQPEYKGGNQGTETCVQR